MQHTKYCLLSEGVIGILNFLFLLISANHIDKETRNAMK